uniref:Uncharacterized protein n=1 Tax=Arundo donax TaxID=35708 RepID=A0A0A8XZD7_ARUDO
MLEAAIKDCNPRSALFQPIHRACGGPCALRTMRQCRFTTFPFVLYFEVVNGPETVEGDGAAQPVHIRRSPSPTAAPCALLAKTAVPARETPGRAPLRGGLSWSTAEQLA